MRNYLPKLLVLIAVICAAGYTLHRVQTCNVVGAGAPITTSAPAPVAAAPVAAASAGTAPPAIAGNTALVYPTPDVERLLKLGYVLFTAHSDGSMTALPLPPSDAMQTTLALPSGGHRRLALTMADPKCAFAVNVEAYRPDMREPLATGQLAAFGKSAPLVVDLAKGSGSNPLLVSLKLANGAANNWFCNITLKWDDKP